MKYLTILTFIIFLLLTGGCSEESKPVGSVFDSEDIFLDSSEQTEYNSEDNAYLYIRADSLNRLAFNFSELEKLLNNPLNTDQWANEVESYCYAIWDICDEIRTIYPPNKYILSHRFLEAAAADYSLAMEYLLIPSPDLAQLCLQQGDISLSNSNYYLQ